MHMDRSRHLLPLVALVIALAVGGCGTASSDTQADDPTTPSASDPTTPPETSATDSPSPSATDPASPTEDAGPMELTTEGLAMGSPPAVDYIADTGGGEQPMQTDPRGGSSHDLEAYYDSFALIGNSMVAVDQDENGPVAVVLDGNLAETSRSPMRGGSLAVTPDGSIIAWLGTDGRPHVIEGGGSREFDLPAVPKGADIAAILSDGTTCQEGEGGNGCAVYVNSGDSKRAWISTSHGIVDDLGQIRAVGDASGRFLAGLVSLSDQGSCWGLFKDLDRTTWETCDHTLTDFSPSGATLLATDAYLDGLGQRSLAFVDMDGPELASWQGTGEDAPTIVQTAWEDDDHALAVVWAAEEWSIVRFGVDGSSEYAVPPVAGEVDRREFTLPDPLTASVEWRPCVSMRLQIWKGRSRSAGPDQPSGRSVNAAAVRLQTPSLR